MARLPSYRLLCCFLVIVGIAMLVSVEQDLSSWERMLRNYHYSLTGSEESGIADPSSSIYPPAATTSATTSTCMGFLEYPFPEHHTGLPFLADTFASHDASIVTFVGMNRGMCDKEWEKADSFASYKDDEKYHRFMCVFHAASIPEVHVMSEYVLSTRPHSPAYLIRCTIPERFRHLVIAGQEETALHVDVLSMEDMELPTTTRHYIRLQPSAEIDSFPRLANIPVCHPASVHETRDRNLPPDSFRLIAYTPIKSSYAIQANKGREEDTLWSSVDRIPEWLEYHHEMQGFDHFIIYDNDEEPGGPIYQKVLPYIESGLVSYRWYPLRNCMSKVSERRMDEAQITGSLSAFHRLGYTADYFSYMDGDEFFVPLASRVPNGTSHGTTENTTIAELADNLFGAHEDYDYLAFRAYVMAPCDGATVEAGGSIVAKWNCRTDHQYAAVKLILRTASMFYFCIHYAVLRMDGEFPQGYELNNETEAYLAHFRVQDEIDGQQRDNYAGVVENEWHRKVDYFEEFLEHQRLKKEEPPNSVPREEELTEIVQALGG